MSDIEATIRAEDDAAQAAGSGAPRVTYEYIKDRIRREYYFTAYDGTVGAQETPVFEDEQPLSLLTLCVLVMENGFTVTGQSACASPENFSSSFGRELARKDAIDKVWALEGYLLRDRLWMIERAPGLTEQVFDPNS